MAPAGLETTGASAPGCHRRVVAGATRRSMKTSSRRPLVPQLKAPASVADADWIAVNSARLPELPQRYFRHNLCAAVLMDFVLMIVIALAAATAGLTGVYLGMKIDGRRRRKLDT